MNNINDYIGLPKPLDRTFSELGAADIVNALLGITGKIYTIPVNIIAPSQIVDLNLIALIGTQRSTKTSTVFVELQQISGINAAIDQEFSLDGIVWYKVNGGGSVGIVTTTNTYTGVTGMTLLGIYSTFTQLGVPLYFRLHANASTTNAKLNVQFVN